MNLCSRIWGALCGGLKQAFVGSVHQGSRGFVCICLYRSIQGGLCVWVPTAGFRGLCIWDGSVQCDLGVLCVDAQQGWEGCLGQRLSTTSMRDVCWVWGVIDKQIWGGFVWCGRV